ncbi:MAG: baseplate assembly protein [Deltaproteobacteria bacterium]|nr:MAG: baseplate assembly protein [Deltaproteobacteria bacterium]TMQ12984.1 MAG: baseplate assembly protein [Deltaproteobacteria bacterium]
MIDPDLIEHMVDWMKSRRYGKYRGVVTDNDDAGTHRGRLKVKVPSVLGDLEVWAEPCVPYAGDGVGFFAMPPVDAGVWVEFEGGDISYPIWVGCYWRDDEPPNGGDPDVKVLQTDAITMTFDDGSEEARIETSGANLTMTDKIEAVAKNGKLTVAAGQVTCDSGGTGKVDVSSSGVVVNNGSLGVS